MEAAAAGRAPEDDKNDDERWCDRASRTRLVADGGARRAASLRSENTLLKLIALKRVEQ